MVDRLLSERNVHVVHLFRIKTWRGQSKRFEWKPSWRCQYGTFVRWSERRRRSIVTKHNRFRNLYTVVARRRKVDEFTKLFGFSGPTTTFFLVFVPVLYEFGKNRVRFSYAVCYAFKREKRFGFLSISGREIQRACRRRWFRTETVRDSPTSHTRRPARDSNGPGTRNSSVFEESTHESLETAKHTRTDVR